MRRRRTAHRFGEKRRTTDVLIQEKVDFSGLMLSSDVLEGLKSAGFERPSPIQLKAIPLGRCGLDLIAQAKSGTGKTCVFSVIALENINLTMTSTQVLVLAPTREIAVQIRDVMCSIGRHLKGLQAHVFIGGMPLEDDKKRLKHCHIGIGTPGRVKHLIENKLLQTTSIRLFILDEADKLLEESFQTQINWIYSTLPSSKQVLALSATYPDHLAEQLKNYMKDPTFVRLNAADPALEGIRHYCCIVPFHSLPHKVFHEKVQRLLQLLSKLSFHQCLIFSNYQIRAKNLSETLAKNGWPSAYISGNQGQNERLEAMAKLKEFKCRILISTDLTSRGIDAERVNLVINMDLPHDSETYLHRVGRAGRFGSYGVTINFVAEGKECTSLNEIEANCGVTITPLPDDVSKLLSEEIMQEVSQQKCSKKVNSSNNIFETETALNKIAIDNKTSNNENGKFGENEYDEICIHEDAEIYPQTTGDNIERHNATITDEVNTTEENEKIEVQLNHEAECKPENSDEERNIHNVGKTDGNKTEENNIQTRFVKENEVEHKEVENLNVVASQKDDTREEPEKQSFVVDHQATENGFNNETFCLQSNIVNGVKNEKKINKLNDEERLPEINRHEEQYNLTENTRDQNDTDDAIADENCKIIFQNRDTGCIAAAERFDNEDFVSDDSESEFSSSGETESSVESHAPISCKDFDNVLDAYLKCSVDGNSNPRSDDLKCKSNDLVQSTDIKDENQVDASKNGIYANLTHLPNDIYANPRSQSPQSLQSNPYESRRLSTNNASNSEDAMFFGATSDDVSAYMTALPAEWTSTWYRLYDRQTNFIMKYTKFCQDNF